MLYITCSLIIILILKKEYYQIDIKIPPPNLVPRVTHKTIEDSNSWVRSKINDYDRSFILHLTWKKMINGTTQSKIYISNDGGISTNEFYLSINGKHISFDEIKSTKGYMFLISYVDSTFAYVDKNGEFSNYREFQERPLFRVHPSFPNVLIKLIDEYNIHKKEISISHDFGKNFIEKLSKCRDEYAWVKNFPYLSLLCNNILYFIDASVGQSLIRSTVEGIDSFECGDDFLFAVSIEVNGEIGNIFRFNLISLERQLVFFPNLLEIREITQVTIFNDHLYVVAKTEDNLMCLFTSPVNENKLIRLICDLDHLGFSYSYCSAYITETEGLIYANKYDYDCFESITYISRNNGNSWETPKLSDDISRNLNEKACVVLHLPCSDVTPHGNSIKRFEVFEGSYGSDVEKVTGHFFTYDWGETWSFVPDIKFSLISLNMGYLLVGVNQITNLVQYTFDEGHTWYSTNVFSNSESMIGEMSSSSTDQEYLIVFGQKSTIQGTSWTFSTIDFQNILSRTCLDSDYHVVAVPHAHTRCFRGKKTVCLHKLNTSLCLHPDDDDKCHEEHICPCTIDDFECSFGFVSENQQCVKDSFHQLEESFFWKCNAHIDYLRGYRRIREDQCSAYEENIDLASSTGNCRTVGLLNFIHCIYSDKFSTIFISENGNTFSRSKIAEHRSYKKSYFNTKFDLEHHRNRVFYSFNNYIYTDKIFDSEENVENMPMYENSANIDEIHYDSVTDSIIFNDISRKLSIVSLETKFKQDLIHDAFSLTFYEKKRAITYLTSDLKFCLYHLFQSSSCIDINDQVLNAKYDEENHRLYFHCKNTSLIILAHTDQVSIKDRRFNADNKKKIIEIINVEFFDFIGQHLYYVKDFQIFKMNLNHLNKINLVTKEIFPNLRSFEIHHVYSMDPNNNCLTKGCSYLCEYTTDNIPKCICPPNSVLEGNKCTCTNMKTCLKHLCMGFWCGNGVCIQESSVCNGYDDCGNFADETNCKNMKNDQKEEVVKFPRIILFCISFIGAGLLIGILIKKYKKWQRNRPLSIFIENNTFDYRSIHRNEEGFGYI